MTVSCANGQFVTAPCCTVGFIVLGVDVRNVEIAAPLSRARAKLQFAHTLGAG